MTRGWWLGAAMAASIAAFALAAGCTGLGQNLSNSPAVEAMGDTVHALPGFQGTQGLVVTASRFSKTVIIHKIAVMPLVDEPDQIDKSVPTGAADSITAALYAKANEIGGWEVVSQDDVAGALQQLPPLTLANMDQNAIALGQKTASDGVLYGTVSRYRERVGFDYAAQTPAAVAFSLKFLDENTKSVIWSAKFAREQKALSENILDLPNFLSHGARWVRAHDIAEEGVNGALDSLQSKITIQPVVQGK